MKKELDKELFGNSDQVVRSAGSSAYGSAGGSVNELSGTSTADCAMKKELEEELLGNSHQVVRLAKSAGFCFGVQRAVELAEAVLEQTRPGGKTNGQSVYLLGELIHNKDVIQSLCARGANIIETPEDCPPGHVLVLRAHGTPRDVYEDLQRRQVTLCDATCPFVKKIHEIMEAHTDETTQTLIAGDEKHPEVIAIRSYAKGKTVCFQTLEDCRAQINQIFPTAHPVVLVAQTTFLTQIWEESVRLILELRPDAKIFHTICDSTQSRQREACALAAESDAMLIVGDRMSSNTNKLHAACEAVCPSYLVEGPEDVLRIWTKLRTFHKIGCTAGASTPVRTIKEVQSTMTEQNALFPDEETEVQDENRAELDEFSAALEESLNAMSTDQKVKGIVMAIHPTEIQVDIGRKQTGYVAFSEYSNDPTADPAKELSVGDSIDLIILRTNESEGTVALSKKRFDMTESWTKVVAAEENGDVLEGRVVEVIKGGILVLMDGMRVFIPGSHSGIPRNDPLESLLDQVVRFRVIELNRQRRRAIGSIRAVAQESRKAALEQFWTQAEVGQVYQGTVKSIVAYGVFVDIGGLDGMIHVSELSWSRVKDPQDIVQVGSEIEVFIKALDPETKKISLGYRKDEENPWEILRNNYPVDSVADATIVSFTTFGAFARIIPGVDGLIHISQIANRRIEKPQDELTVGQTVSVKVVGIDFEKRRVSLSMRALLPEEEEAVAPETEPAEIVASSATEESEV